MTSANPLLEQPHLLDFAQITPEHIAPAIETLLSQARQALQSAQQPQTAADWEHFVTPMENAIERLGRAWSAVGHLMGVMDSPALRAAYNETLPVVTQFFIDLSQNEALFAKYKQLRGSAHYDQLDSVRRRYIDQEIRDFTLSGADLPEQKKARVKQIGEELAQLTQKFSENLLDATNAFTLDITDSARLQGIPDDALALYASEAQAAQVPGWRITLHYPSYLPAMQYAQDRSLRRELYEAFTTRASDLGAAERDNTPLIVSILTLRHEQAQLLGFDNYGELSLATKMAKSPAEVIDFLLNLNLHARPYALADQEQLGRFAHDTLGIEQLEAWDQAYASEKLRQARYAYAENEVKQYFTEPTVFAGLFALVERMFAIHIEPDTAPVWHPDVKFFRITDKHGQLIAQFYTDLYARASKRGGAWMDNDLSRKRNADGSVCTPTAYLVCNFSRPVGNQPAVLTHDDVTTLFHEFGHGLHHMLTQVDIAQLSGINGVQWDAVELPSQFMENWAWQYDIIKTISSHVKTQEVLPRTLFDKMLAAKNFQAGLFCVRQLEFALFDMRIHSTDALEAANFPQVLDRVRQEVGVVPVAPFNRFAHSFAHIFAGGYAAGYYSYKWAEVLSADIFAAFEEEGLFNQATGLRWLQEILAVGGSRDALDSFIAFRGRQPSIDALLRHSGMSN